MSGNLLRTCTSIVLYQQLADVLRQYFRESRMLVGDRLPTEFDLASKYEVSRGTVRRALSLLQEEGLIERIPGRGTFLRGEPVRNHLDSPRRIGLIIPYAQDQLGLNILVGVESVAKYRGYQVVFNHTNESLEEEKADIARMLKDSGVGDHHFPR